MAGTWTGEASLCGSSARQCVEQLRPTAQDKYWVRTVRRTMCICVGAEEMGAGLGEGSSLHHCCLSGSKHRSAKCWTKLCPAGTQ